MYVYTKCTIESARQRGAQNRFQIKAHAVAGHFKNLFVFFIFRR